MKKILYVLSAIVILAATASCEKFLDMSPDENLTLDDVFAVRQNTRAFLANAYSYLPFHADMSWDNNFTGSCDEMEIAYGAHTTHAMSSGAWAPVDDFVAFIWTSMYEGIRKVNLVIENADRCEDATADEIRWMKGESYFLRAFYHFMIFRAYGPIPIVDHVIDINEDIASIVQIGRAHV